MTRDERADKLVAAARLIGEVAADLDRNVGNCECCGAYKYDNRAHYQMGLELDAVVKKLMNFARQFRQGRDVWRKTEGLGN